MGGEVSSSIFATLGLSSAEGELLLCSTAGCVCLLLPLSSSVWGRYQVKESCHFAPPHSVSVFIFVCLHLHLPASSSTYIIIHPPTLLTAHVIIFLHLCPSLWYLVVSQWYTYINNVCGISHGMSKGLCCVVMSSHN